MGSKVENFNNKLTSNQITFLLLDTFDNYLREEAEEKNIKLESKIEPNFC